MKTYFIERKVIVTDVYKIEAESYNEAKLLIKEDRHNGKRINNDGIITFKNVSESYRKNMLEPRKRTALDGKAYWCVFDTNKGSWSTLTCFGKYARKKDCQRDIDFYMVEGR